MGLDSEFQLPRCSADFAIYQLLSRNGLDPNKDVTLLSIAGSPDARFAALIRGLVDATVVNSPLNIAPSKNFKILLSIKETAEFVKISINGLSTSQRKIDREPDEIVRMLRGAAQREFVFAKSARDQCRVSGKLLKLERPVAERFYALHREQFNPDLTVPEAVVEEWISVGTFRAKEKITAKP